jgi:pre-rRNA-processing protein TSR3
MTKHQRLAVFRWDRHSVWSMTWPTIIIVHPKERRAKCTVAPLRGDPRFLFYKHPRRPDALAGYVRLGINGPPLSVADASSGLLLLDGTWRWAERMEANVAEVPVRSLPRFVTAYPRTSRVFDDPDGGLATVEALYAALTILQRDTTGLLAHYPFAADFLARNRELLPDPSGQAARSSDPPDNHPLIPMASLGSGPP